MWSRGSVQVGAPNTLVLLTIPEKSALLIKKKFAFLRGNLSKWRRDKPEPDEAMRALGKQERAISRFVYVFYGLGFASCSQMGEVLSCLSLGLWFLYINHLKQTCWFSEFPWVQISLPTQLYEYKLITSHSKNAWLCGCWFIEFFFTPSSVCGWGMKEPVFIC